MKKLSPTLTILIMCGLLFTSISWTNIIVRNMRTDEQQDNRVLLLSKTYTINAIKDVDVSSSGGSISVAGDATGNASVEVFGQSNNGKRLSKEVILEILKNDYEFSVDVQNGTLKAIAKRKVSGMWKKSVSISFKIHVGKNVNTDLHTSGGSLSLSTLHGTESFTTSGGSIHFENLSGNIHGHTSGGSITALKSDGNIKATTSGGAIHLENLKGDIQTHTSGGSIDAAGVSGSLVLSTSGGSLQLSDIGAKLSASTSGGSINAKLAKLTQDVDLGTSGGSINLTISKTSKVNFELKGSRVNIGAANNIQVEMNKQKNHATGSLNNGGVHLNAHTSGGTVNLDFN